MVDGKSIRIMLVGGEDLDLRIPFIKKLQDNGVEVMALGSGSADRFNAAGVPFTHYGLSREFDVLSDISSLKQIGDLAKKFSPNIVHAFDTKPSVLVPLILPDIPSRRCVRTITGLGYLFSGETFKQRILRRIYMLLQRCTASRCAMTIFQNSDDLNVFLKASLVQSHNSSIILGSGVDVDELTRRVRSGSLQRLRQEFKLEGKLVVLMAARINRSKGVFEFCKAASAICAERSDVVFLLVGPCEEGIADGLKSTEIEKHCLNVHYLGARSDLIELMAICDLFVLPSYYREGVPRVLLEAGALQKPLITTDMPGCRDVVTNNSEGILVPVRDVEQLRNAIKFLLDRPQLRAEYGINAQQRVREKFSLAKICKEYLEIYQNLQS